MTESSDSPFLESENPASLSTRNRGPGRPWKPGESGNRGGLPKEVAEARRLALSHAPSAIARLVDMLASTDDRVVVAAATALLDRGGLRPYSLEPERIEVSAAVDPEQLRTLLLARLAALAAAPEPVEVAGRQIEPAALPAAPEGES